MKLYRALLSIFKLASMSLIPCTAGLVLVNRYTRDLLRPGLQYRNEVAHVQVGIVQFDIC